MRPTTKYQVSTYTNICTNPYCIDSLPHYRGFGKPARRKCGNCGQPMRRVKAVKGQTSAARASDQKGEEKMAWDGTTFHDKVEKMELYEFMAYMEKEARELLEICQTLEFGKALGQSKRVSEMFRIGFEKFAR